MAQNTIVEEEEDVQVQQSDADTESSKGDDFKSGFYDDGEDKSKKKDSEDDKSDDTGEENSDSDEEAEDDADDKSPEDDGKKKTPEKPKDKVESEEKDDTEVDDSLEEEEEEEEDEDEEQNKRYDSAEGEDSFDYSSDDIKAAAELADIKLPEDLDEKAEELKEYKEDFPEGAQYVDEQIKKVPLIADRVISEYIKRGILATTEELNEMRAENIELRILVQHPDYHEVRESEKYKEWLEKQAPQIKRYDKSSKPENRVFLLNKYKEEVKKEEDKAADEDERKEKKRVDSLHRGSLRNKNTGSKGSSANSKKDEDPSKGFAKGFYEDGEKD